MPGPCQRGFLQRPIESEGGSEAHWLDAFLSNRSLSLGNSEFWLRRMHSAEPGVHKKSKT